MKLKLVEETSAEYLRSARPRLICLVEPEVDGRFKLTPYIREGENECEEVVIEGYDPDGSPLGCPVYWRIVKRGAEEFYCSTFIATGEQVKRAWGTMGLGNCDLSKGSMVARIEARLPTEGEPNDLKPTGVGRGFSQKNKVLQTEKEDQ